MVPIKSPFAKTKIEDLKPGDHLCFFFLSDAEHRAVMTPFLAQGLAAGEKILYLTDRSAPRVILGYLKKQGIKAEPYLHRGQLQIIDASAIYLSGGFFDPEAMLTRLQQETEQALAEGYSALRLTGEMTWATRGYLGSERLAEFEARLNEFMPGSRCLAVCQYDRRQFDPVLLMDILAAHPKVIIGAEVMDNIYYLPPGEFLSPEAKAAKLAHFLDNLAERQRSEATLARQTHELTERLKELNCLLNIAELTERPRLSLEDILQSIVELIPPAWQYSEITASRLVLGEKEFKTKNFQKTPWIMASDLVLQGKNAGRLEVCHLEPRAEADEGPFLGEERSLLNAIAGLTGRIAERLQAEEALREHKEQLERVIEERTAELRKANLKLQQEIKERHLIEDALEKGAEKIKIFAYSVIHDLKNPAIGIYGVSNLLKKHYGDLLDERGRKYCDQIMRASEQIATLLKKINAYIVTKEAPLNIKSIDLKEIFQLIKDEFAEQLELRQVKWQEPQSISEVQADGLYILRALRNLVDNALKYGGDKLSEITLGYTDNDRFHILSVTDNGVGLKLADPESIFKAFQRFDTAEGVEGSGLGLAIVKEIAERHLGQVWVDSTPDQGTTFFLSIAKEV